MLGEKKTVTVSVPVEELACYDTDKRCFAVNGGKYALYVARDCRDDRFVLEYEVKGDNDTVDLSDKYPAYYNVGADFDPSDEEFLTLYGRELADTPSVVNVSTALNDVGNSLTAKIFVKALTKNKSAESKRNTLATPLRALVSDRLSREMLITIIDMLNGAAAKNIFRLFKQYLACRKARKAEQRKKGGAK